MSMGNPEFFSHLIAHGMGGSCPCNLDCFSALETGVQHLICCMGITSQIGFQVVEYPENGKISMYPAVVIGCRTPVAFNSLGQCIHRTAFFMVFRKAVQKLCIQQNAGRPQVRMAQPRFDSVYVHNSILGCFRAASGCSGYRNMRQFHSFRIAAVHDLFYVFGKQEGLYSLSGIDG